MRIKEIEFSAAKGVPLPPYPTVPEMCLYTSLRALYTSWRKREISTDIAQAEKRRIISECEQYETQYKAWTEAYRYYQTNIRRAGMLLSKIEKSDDVSDIALLSVDAIGLMTGDEVFPKRVRKRIREK